MNLANIVSICVLCFISLYVFFILYIKLHELVMNQIQVAHKIIIFITMLATILICILPMPLSPYWNGTMKVAADMQQYDRLGDALLEGHLYIDKGDIDPALQTMDNPYDPVERERLGVKYHWDEVYYNHHYYTYFGIVPTIILFIPYKLLTGEALLTYQATQIFASLLIVGLFFLFFIFSKILFPNLPFSIYLLLTTTFSVLSVGYSIAAPALYCTAIISAICLMIWSITSFIKGLWLAQSLKESKAYLFAGALLGAMAFGCRPPVALANLIIIAVILHIKEIEEWNHSEKAKVLVYIIVPYVLVGLLLILYNYARFGNPFEFGISYQLTLADQHLYQSFAERFDLKRILTGISVLLFGITNFTRSFPHVVFCGIFINFPIFLFSFYTLFSKVTITLKEKKMHLMVLLLFVSFLFIAFTDVYWTPFPLPRYQLDFCFLLCIITFIAIGAWLENGLNINRKWMISLLVFLSFFSVFTQFLLFCIPYDGSFTACYPGILEEIHRGFRFGL